MKPITRRTGLKRIALAAASIGLPGVVRPFSVFAGEGEMQHSPTQAEGAAIAEIARQTMGKFNVPGLSVAVARHGQFVYRQGFGFANKETAEGVTAAHLFRIASVSKAITSAAIFTLVEQGRLALDNLIFGEKGVLKFDYLDFGGSYHERVGRITLHHLLTHTCGGWDNSGKQVDPMFYKPAMDHWKLITWTLRELPLENEPGTHYAYSNFGYCLLGRVIEKVTGQPYADYAQSAVLSKCGIADMRIGGNTLADRAVNEVVYYGRAGSGANPYDINVTRMDSHGGWIGTPSDLARFAMHVDGFLTTPNILKAATIKTMTTPTAQNPEYACGWCVNRRPNWWHGGSLPGTLTILVRTGSGLCWAAFANTRVSGLNLDEMMWRMVKAVPAWRA
ncbi:MAG TPA: serine hydrolase domain-containing protein [Verrucomicrobiae bacterium]|nr:serine hydrolase domain-containing protein [Verrucomicrobiae bacterium]